MNGLTLRVRPDKVGSVCMPFGFGPYLTVSDAPIAAEGAAVVARTLSARDDYGSLELGTGRLARLVPGDLIVGCLGNRAALRGFSGRVPKKLRKGDTLHLLNTGGVVGRSEGTMVGLGEPIRLEVVGTPLIHGSPALLSDRGIPPRDKLPEEMPPVLFVAGTCMNAGKSTAAAAIIRALRSQNLRVHAGKATGVAAIRDLLSFRDHGATRTLSFMECGAPSTAYRDDVPALTKTILAELADEEPDVIVMELGDGLMGSYGVDEIVDDPEVAGCVTGAVLAANDLVGGWAAVQRLRDANMPVFVVTGPATDNVAGIERLRSLGVNAANTFREPQEMARLAIEPLLEGSR